MSCKMKLVCLECFVLRSRQVTGILGSGTPRLSLRKLVRKKRKYHDVPELGLMWISVIFYCAPSICRIPRQNICNTGTEAKFSHKHVWDINNLHSRKQLSNKHKEKGHHEKVWAFGRVILQFSNSQQHSSDSNQNSYARSHITAKGKRFIS